MIKLISTGSSILIMDSKFYRHGYITKLESPKNSHNFLRKLFIMIKPHITSIKSKL